MKRHHSGDQSNFEPNKKKRVSFTAEGAHHGSKSIGPGHGTVDSGKNPNKFGPTHHSGKHNSEDSSTQTQHSWNTLAKKKWTTANKPAASLKSSFAGIDISKRDALVKTLDLKTLFDFLNSTEENALEVGLAAFEFRMEQEHEQSIPKAPQASASTEKESDNTIQTETIDEKPKYFLLKEYLEKSPEVHELWTILEYCIAKDKTKSTLAIYLLRCFSAILDYNKWPHLLHMNNTIGRKITKSHFHMFGSNLSSENYMLINATFKLMTSIVLIGPYHARDVFTGFNWAQKSFFALCNKKNASYEDRKKNRAEVTQDPEKKESEYSNVYLLDVRTHYIRFALAFMEHDDHSLTQDVLAVPNFVASIFKELYRDATALVLQVFEIIHEHVILNKSVSKKSKINLFNSKILEQISVVYKRFTASNDKKLGALASVTRRRIQACLESLFTSPNEGIVFTDLPKPFPASARLLHASEDIVMLSTAGTLSTSDSLFSSSSSSTESWFGHGPTKNKNILKFLMLLEPQSSSWQEKLLLKVLEKDAQLKRQYYESLRISIEPRESLQWLNNISFLIKLLDQRPFDLEMIVTAVKDVINRHSNNQVGHDVPDSSNMLVSSFSFDRLAGWFVPHCCLNRNALSQGLRKSNPSIQFVTINFILKIFKVIDDIISEIDRQISLIRSSETHPLLAQIKDSLTNVFKRRLPDLENALFLLEKKVDPTVSADAILTAETESKKEPTPSGNPALATTDEKMDLAIDASMLYGQIMSFTGAYLRRFPESFTEQNISFGKLFVIPKPWLVPSRMQEGYVSMLEEAASRLNWNDLVHLPKSSNAQKSTKVMQISALLRFMIYSTDDIIKSRVKSIVTKILERSGLFDKATDEIPIWLHSLSKNPSDAALVYFVTALETLSKRPYQYADLLKTQVEKSEDLETQALWKLPSFPQSSLKAPFSLLLLTVLIKHSQILQNILGGPSNAVLLAQRMATEAPSAEPEPNMKQDYSGYELVAVPSDIVKVSDFVVSTVLSVLYSQQLPLPLILAIMEYSTPTFIDPSAPVQQVAQMDVDGEEEEAQPIKRPQKIDPFEIVAVELQQHQSFGSILRNLRGFIYKIFSLSPPPEHTPIGQLVISPLMNDRSLAIQNIFASIFDLGPIEGSWNYLGPTIYLSHILSAPQRATITKNPQLTFNVISMIQFDPIETLAVVNLLLFFIGTFLEDEFSGDCLHFAMGLLASIFSNSVDKIKEKESKLANLSKNTSGEDEDQEEQEKLTRSIRDERQMVVVMLKLILANPLLNLHFLKDISSSKSIMLSHVIAQLLEAMVVQSQEQLFAEVQDFSLVPLSKLCAVFSSNLVSGNISGASECIPIVKTLAWLLSGTMKSQISTEILSLGSTFLLSAEGQYFLGLLLFLLLPNAHEASKNLTGSFNKPFQTLLVPSHLDHLILPPLISEAQPCYLNGPLPSSIPSNYFESPFLTPSAFSKLLDLFQNAAQHKESATGYHSLCFLIEQVIFRVLVSSQVAQYTESNQSNNTPTFTRISPDFGIEVDSKFIDSSLSIDLFAEISSDEAVFRAQNGGSVPHLHRAAFVSLFPGLLVASKPYKKILKKLSEQKVFATKQFSFKRKEVLPLLEGTSGTAILHQMCLDHQSSFFALILLTSHLKSVTTQFNKKEISKETYSSSLEMLAKSISPFKKIISAFIILQGLFSDKIHTTMVTDTQADLLSEQHLSVLSHYGVPVFLNLLELVPEQLLEESEKSDLKSTLAAIANQKGRILVPSQFTMLRILYHDDFDPLVGITVKQAAAVLQNISQMADQVVTEESKTVKLNHTNSLPHLVFYGAILMDFLNSQINTFSEMDASDLLANIRRLLRFGYERGGVLKWLSKLLACESVQSNSSLLSDIHDLVVSHSSFAKILLNQDLNPESIAAAGTTSLEILMAQLSVVREDSYFQDELTKSARTLISLPRTPLLQVISQIYGGSLSTSKFSPKMLALYLSAYGASLAPSDQLLLHIIMTFERHSISFSQAGFLWGETAQEYKTTSIAIGLTNQMQVDGKQDSTAGIPQVDLATLHSMLLSGKLTNHKKMMNTIRNFPSKLLLATGSTVMKPSDLWHWFLQKDHQAYFSPILSTPLQRSHPHLSSLYDPRFILFIYYFGINHFPQFDCKKFVEVGGFSLVLQSISADDPQLRRLGYAILAKYSDVLDEGKIFFREAVQLRLLIKVLRATISEENMKLPAVTCSFLGEASLILVRPDHSLFLEIHGFLLSRPLLDLKSVPALHRFMQSSKNSQKMEREWIFKMLENGLRSPTDISTLGLRVRDNQHNSSDLRSVSLSSSSQSYNSRLFSLLLSHLSSHIPSSFSSITERQRLWGIIKKVVYLDAPFYKNTLTGAGGILPFITHWTSSHHLAASASGIVTIPSAAVASLQVFTEVSSIIEMIAQIPELPTLAKSFTLWTQFLPLITNIVSFLEASDAQIGGLGQTASQENNRSAASNNKKIEKDFREQENLDEEEESTSEVKVNSKNPYWKLLFSCIKILFQFASSLSQPPAIPLPILSSLRNYLNQIGGPIIPQLLIPNEKFSQAAEQNSTTSSIPTFESGYHCSSYSNHIYSGDKANPFIGISQSEVEATQAHVMLSLIISLDQPDLQEPDHQEEQLSLFAYSLKILLLLEREDGMRYKAFNSLVSKLVLCIKNSNSKFAQLLAQPSLSKDSNDTELEINIKDALTLRQSLLYLFRELEIENQQEIFENEEGFTNSKTNMMIRLNTLFTSITAQNILLNKKSSVQSTSKAKHGSWEHLLENWLPETLRNLHGFTSSKPIPAKFIHNKEEIKLAYELSAFFRDFWALDGKKTSGPLPQRLSTKIQ